MMSYLDPSKLKNWNIAATIASIAVPLVVIVLMTPGLLPKIQLPFDPTILPMLHAILNGMTAFSLIAALYFIKQKQIEKHQFAMTLGVVLSMLFLLSYVLYHASSESTLYGDTNHDRVVDAAEKLAAGNLRTVYFFFLATHILLAAVVIPFVLFTYLRGWSRQDAKHKKLAKITFPMWLYVAITGVICYLMLAPYYH